MARHLHTSGLSPETATAGLLCSWPQLEATKRMATQTTKGSEQNQQRQGQAMAPGSTGQATPARRGAYLAGMSLSPADLFRMNPFSLMRRMTEEFDRAFSGSAGIDQSEVVWAPVIEVAQQEGKYVVRAELPGLIPDDVKLQITDDAIVIQGERKEEHEEEKGGIHVSERRYGRFFRAIPLPDGVKAADARARFENGVLEITVPMEEQRSQRREIPIEGSSGAGASGARDTSAGKPAGSTGSAGGSEKAA
jgi:HSP20 family protein